MAEMLLKAQKYMNTEDVLAAIGDEEKPREREKESEKTRGDVKEKGETVGVLTEISVEIIKLRRQ